MEYISYDYFINNNFFNSENILSYIALGFFDGVHLGHQAILRLCVDMAKEDNTMSSVILLDPHPEIIVNKNDDFCLLTTLEEKARHIKSLGIKKVYVLNFSKEFREISSEGFIKEVLLKKFHMGAVFVGYDYHFGYQKKGNANLLKLLAKKYNFKHFILEPVKTDDGKIISSTLIRKLIREGDLDKANHMLGYSYYIGGEVVHGYKRGKKVLSFPTANIKLPPEKLLPKNGVYVALVEIDGKKYQGLVNIGFRPTFQNETIGIRDEISVEAHIFNYGADIYEKRINIFVLKRIRDEQRFVDTASLTQQIRKDGLFAQAFFEDNQTKELFSVTGK